MISKGVVSSILIVFAVAMFVASPVMAGDEILFDSNGTWSANGGSGSYSIAGGYMARVRNSSDYAMALGYYAEVKNDADYSMSIGSNSQVGDDSTGAIAFGSSALVKYSSPDAVAIGNNSQVGYYSESAIAIGDDAQVQYYSGESIAIGSSARVRYYSEDAIAIGDDSYVGEYSDYSIAIGDDAEVASYTENSVALGAGSYASEPNTVSVGDVGSERRITNVAPGVNGTDAVNVSQLKNSQKDSERYAAAGIAAALAMPPIWMPSGPGKHAFGIEVAAYDDAEAIGAAWAMRMSEHMAVNLGVSAPFGGDKGNVAFRGGVSFSW